MKYLIYASPATGPNKDSYGFFDKNGFIEPLCWANEYTLDEAQVALAALKSKDPEGDYRIMFVLQ